jgi:ABC-type sugar transport system permease subunit
MTVVGEDLTEDVDAAHADAGKPIEPIALLRMWHIALVVLSGAGLIAVITAGDGLPAPIRVVLGAAGVAGLVANAWAIGAIGRRANGGRTASIAVNYLLFVGASTALLSMLDVFTGLDEVAERFQSAIWWLAIPSIGWAWRIVAAKLPATPASHNLGRAGNALIVAGSIVFAFAVGIIDGVVHMLGELLAPWPIACLVVAVAALGALRFLWRPDTRTEFGTTSGQQEQIEGLLYLSPNLLGFLAFFAGPLVFSFVISFFEWDALGDKSFTWFGNYQELFSLDMAFMDSSAAPASAALKDGYAQLWRFELFGSNIMISARDKLFWISLRNIVWFMVLAVPLSVLPALICSSLLNSKLRGMKIYRAVFFIPSIAGVIGISLIWRQMFNATVGWLNYLLTEALPGDVSIQWLSDSSTAMISIVIVFAWMTFGFNTILFVAGLQGINPSMYEAAKLDGANAWQRFRFITVPSLRPTTFFVVAITTIQAIQLFDIVFVTVTPNPAGPQDSTLTPVLYLYQEGFQRFSQGYASAVAWVLFALIFGLTLLQFRRQQAEVEAAR